MVQVYGRKKCPETRKAQRFFSDRGIQVQSIDLDTKAPGRRELELFAQIVGADALIDDQSRIYSGRGLGYMEFDPLEEISEAPGLLRTPVVRSGRTITIGDDEAGWRRIAELESGGA